MKGRKKMALETAVSNLRGSRVFCNWASYSIPTTGSFWKKCCKNHDFKLSELS
jgi:hypothetical protein